jgi:cellulose synthase/poly-beta-1,6-N-acetylglucosamine synthase-like glycosyltransferase
MPGVAEYFIPIALVAWLIFSAVSLHGTYFYLRGVGHRYQLAVHPAAVVIIPIRGVPECFSELWAALLAQTYDRWRVMFVVESETDPACAAIRAEMERARPSWPIEIVVAGATTKSSQLNHNCLAAIRRLRPEDEVVVLTVADMVPAPEWLAQIIHPLNTPAIWFVSAYPFMFPADRRLSTAVACALCQSVACVPRIPETTGIAWGGTMALRRQTLETLDLQRWWGGTISNDSTMTRALWEKGGSVYGGRVMLIPSRESLSWIELVRLWRRWYLNARLYLPLYWLGAAVGSLIPIVGWATAIPLAIGGNVAAIGVMATAFGLHQWRATVRRRLRLALSPGHDDRVLALADRWGAPAWCVLRAAIIWSVLFMRTVRWAGRVYRVEGPHRILVVEGPGTPASSTS